VSLSRNWLKIIFFLILLFSPWFEGFPLLIKILVTATSAIFCFYPKKFLIYFSLIILAIAQLSTTRVKTVFEFSGFEQYQYNERQKEYPGSFFRLGQIVEKTIAHPQIYRFQKNFFDCFDFLDYFKNLLPTFLFFPFVYGLIKFIKKPQKALSIGLILSILFLTFIGPKGNFGQFLLFPFITFFITHAFAKG
jgi:hypothetical protein